jgi:hypothetical protein
VDSFLGGRRIKNTPGKEITGGAAVVDCQRGSSGSCEVKPINQPTRKKSII